MNKLVGLIVLVAVLSAGTVLTAEAQILKYVQTNCMAFSTTDELNTYIQYIADGDNKAATNYALALVLSGDAILMQKGDQVYFESCTGFLCDQTQVRYPGSTLKYWTESEFIKNDPPS